MPDAATEVFICCDKLSCTEASDGLAKAISLAITLALLERQALNCTGGHHNRMLLEATTHNAWNMCY